MTHEKVSASAVLPVSSYGEGYTACKHMLHRGLACSSSDACELPVAAGIPNIAHGFAAASPVGDASLSRAQEMHKGFDRHLVEQDDVSIGNLLLSLIDSPLWTVLCQLAANVAGIHHRDNGVQAHSTAQLCIRPQCSCNRPWIRKPCTKYTQCMAEYLNAGVQGHLRHICSPQRQPKQKK